MKEQSIFRKQLDRKYRIYRCAQKAYDKGVNGSIIFRFIGIYLKNDEERDIFFKGYASAAYNEGFEYSCTDDEDYPYDNDMSQY